MSKAWGDRQFLLEFLNEFAVWYQNLAAKGALPRALTGIDAQGAQFLVRLDGITLEHEDRHGLVQSILREEGAVSYAYGGPKPQESTEERLTLIAATGDYFVMGEWKVYHSPEDRLEQTELWEGDNPQEVPGAWFLTEAIRPDKNETARYEKIWRALRQQALLLQRPES